MGITAAQLIASVSVTGANQAKADLEGVGKAVDDSAKYMDIAREGAKAAGEAIIEFAADSVQKAGDFESSMIKIKTSAGETGTLTSGNLKIVSDGILQLATVTGTSADDLAQSMYFIESAGMRGAQGLNVLKAASEGAKLENVDTTQVTRALLAVMEGYHMPASQATEAMNSLVSATAHGGASLSELTSAMAQVLPTASSLHIPFAQVAAAIGVMTNKQTSAQQAAQNLAHVLLALESPTSKASDAMTNVGLSAQKVRDALVNQGLPQALQLIEDHVGKQFPKNSVEYTTALKDILGGLVGFKLAAQLTGPSLKDMQTDVNAVSSAAKDGSGKILGWAETQDTLNVKISQAKEAVETLQIKLGTALIPVVGQVVSAFTNFVPVVESWMSNANNLIPVLTGVGTVIAGLLIPAAYELAAGIIAATWPILLIGAAVAGLVAIFMHFYQTSAPFRGFINGIGHDFQQLWSALTQSSVLNQVQKIFQQVGGYLAVTFMPVLKQLQVTWQTQLLPAIQQLLPALKPIAELVGGLLIVAFGLLIGIIVGTVRAFAALLQGAIQISGGVIQMMTGMVQIVSGLLTFLYDLFTLQWGKIGSDLGTIWAGILNIARGFGNAFMGFFGGLFLAVRGLVGGFIDGVIGYFTDLYNALVGHSIIPDMVNGIISWFQQLPGRALSAISSLGSSISGYFSGLASQAMAWGSDMISNFASGIANSAGGLIAQAQSIASNIASILHFSKPDRGPLVDADKWMPDMMQLLSSGIEQNMDKVKNSSLKVGATISASVPSLTVAHSFNPSGLSTSSTSSGGFASALSSNLQGASVVPATGIGNNTQPVQVVVQPAPIYLDGHVLATSLLPHTVNAIRYNVGSHNI